MGASTRVQRQRSIGILLLVLLTLIASFDGFIGVQFPRISAVYKSDQTSDVDRWLLIQQSNVDDGAEDTKIQLVVEGDADASVFGGSMPSVIGAGIHTVTQKCLTIAPRGHLHGVFAAGPRGPPHV